MATARKTYAEQLKHPMWQRRRLEMLQKHDFACEMCADKETTLHVHHKRYVKGREIWEYGDSELQVLCENCHAEHHEMHKLLEEVLASSTGWDPYRTALGLVAGYMDACYSLDYDLANRAAAAAPIEYKLGVVAAAVALSPKRKVAQAVLDLRQSAQLDPVLANLLAAWLSDDTPAGDQGE